ncbi:sterol desaturase family protein [Ulvibacter antarcticus]|uniref:Sterol desaturase/sphingolipid hydroxylase (Fatty acid hydroxylase superfamily) n=1 Tax=Ulvibacter antarcticus TaxID=442714 RepID=A0A3L9YCJ2_9FLAO|nr:sterol desaturase family protein [Ulvibacter antarcticus]RMA58084.1 sterol desaturase/sphingolipid hydroxylase (fatty acid hydroxylase superfamily) [Ulvibacter antarcticus]
MKNLLNQLPSPLELILDPLSLVILGIYVSLMIWEALFPARQLPKVKYWKLKGIIAFILFFLLSSYLPLLWDEYLAAYQIFNLTGIGTFWGALAGILVYEFGEYVWHRTMHSSNILWKGMHQMHHSAERLDSYGAFYFSPLDMVGWVALSSICLIVVAGFTPEATTLIILITTFLTIFQHSNIKTPRWIGYLIQRPEAHTIHHARGIHAYNYAGITLFDILFGTFRNPKNYKHETGFYQGASAKVKEMLLFKDISKGGE